MQHPADCPFSEGDYLLTQEEYAELCLIRDKLLLLAQLAGTTYANGNHDNILFIRRSMIGQLFADLSNHLVEVLELITQEIDRTENARSNQTKSEK